MKHLRLWWIALLAALLSGPSLADDGKMPKFDAVGPSKVVLGDKLATLNLPKGYAFFGRATTQKLMESMGNRSDGSELGLVISTRPESQDYMILLEYDDTGHVKDDELIDKDKLLDSMKEGTEAQNEERKSKGMPAIHVVGWVEEPRYEKELHHVVWAPKGTVEGEGDIVNFNTRILGRTGVLSVNLMCDTDKLEKRKPDAAAILKATSFNEGKRYQDFQAGDKLAEFGLMGLILGGAGAALAKKTGLMAILYLVFKKGMLLVLALKKFLIFIVIGVVAVARKGFAMLTGRGSSESEVASAPPPPPSSMVPPPPPQNSPE